MQKNLLMENKIKKIGIAIIALLSIITVISIGYAVKFNKEKKETESTLIAEKQSVLKQLTLTKDSLDAAIASNTSLSDELIAERDKVQNLINQLESAKATYQTLLKYKSQSEKLQSSVHRLMQQVDVLKNENIKLTTTIDSTSVELDKSKKHNDTLSSQKELMVKHIRKAAKLNVVNFHVDPAKSKESGLFLQTDKAIRVNVLKINFTLPENHLAKSGEKKFFVQIIDSHNNVIGDKEVQNFTNGDKLTYSLAITADYQNKTLLVQKDMPVKYLYKGDYSVNLYDDTQLLTKTSFTLK